jgi:hypothetical protein
MYPQRQGDQHGHIFSYWAIVFFGKILCAFLATVFHSKSYAIILTKKGSVNILGDFFTNSAGHTAQRFGTHVKLSLRSQIPSLLQNTNVYEIEDVKAEQMNPSKSRSLIREGGNASRNCLKVG